MSEMNIFNRVIKSKNKKTCVVLLLIFSWVYFYKGGVTDIEYRFDNNGNGFEIFVDDHKLTQLPLIEEGKYHVGMTFFPTFIDDKQIKQKIKQFYFRNNGIQLNTDEKRQYDISELKGNILGVKIKNLEQGSFYIEKEDIKYTIHLRPLRENDMAFGITKYGGQENFIFIANHIPLNPWQQFKKIMMIISKPFPVLIIFLLLPRKKKDKILKISNNGENKQLYLITVLVLIFSFFWLFYLNQNFLDGIPHVGDAVSYLMQAKFLSTRHVCGNPNISNSIFDFFKGWGPLSFNNGRWCGYYPFGHPLMLSLGVIAGNPGIIPPLLGTLSLLFLFVLGNKLYNFWVGLLAMVIIFISPFFQMNAASFMSHNTAVFYEIAGIFIMILAVKKERKIFFIGSGVFWGLLFNTRPLTIVGLSIPILSYLILKKVKFRYFFIFAVSVFVSSSLYFVYNYLSFGGFINNPYMGTNKNLFTQGSMFLINYLLVIQTHLITFLKVFHGWPYVVSIFMLFLPIIVYWSEEVILFTLCILGIVLASGLFDGGTYAITYGPRYWFEVIPFISILFAISINYLFNYFHLFVLKIIIGCLVLGLITFTCIGWIKGKPVLWKNVGFTPANIEELHTFNSTDGRLIKTARELKIKNAVIFVKECSGWWCYGSVLPQNSPDLNSDILWAMDLKERNSELFDKYPDRKFFIADYDRNVIIPIISQNIRQDGIN